MNLAKVTQHDLGDDGQQIQIAAELRKLTDPEKLNYLKDWCRRFYPPISLMICRRFRMEPKSYEELLRFGIGLRDIDDMQYFLYVASKGLKTRRIIKIIEDEGNRDPTNPAIDAACYFLPQILPPRPEFFDEYERLSKKFSTRSSFE